MNKLYFSLLLVVFAVVSCQKETHTVFDDPDVAVASPRSEPIPGQYIVVLRQSAIPELGRRSFATISERMEVVQTGVLDFMRRHDLSDVETLHHYGSAMLGFAAQLKADQVERLRVDAMVSHIEQDQVMHIFQRGRPGGGGGSQPNQSIPWGISRVNGGVSGVGKRAWILDTGIDLTHPDLNVSTTDAFSAFTKGRDTGFDDGNGHGTHVAGTIAAIDNSIGVIGVAAGATVVPVKVLGANGSGSTSGIIAGVDHVKAYGSAGDVANMSLGGGASTALDNAVISAAASGIKFVLAAGNSSADANNYSPARANGPNIFTVSAMSQGDNWASFSNYSNPPIDWCAPGVSILSTWRGSGYNTISGTSMAAPHVAGVLLLGNIRNGGAVNGDPDGNPDPIAVH